MKGKSYKSNRTRGSRPAARMLAAALALIFIVQFVGCNSCSKPGSDDIDLPNVSLEPVPATKGPGTSSSPSVVNRNGYSVSTSNIYATMVAAQVLDAGGNAVDAAVAAAYTLAVVESYASGIGGGGGMLIYDPKTDKYQFLNYLPEAAQSGANYRDIAVPGFVSGMETANELYGSFSMASLMNYAIYYAENGFTVDDALMFRIKNARATFSDPNTPFAAVQNAGDTVALPELAQVLRRISTEGSSAFYTGSVAQSIANAAGMTLEDLSAYETLLTDPLIGEFNGYDVISAPAPFGGMTLIQMLKMGEILEIPDPDTDPSGYLKKLTQLTLICDKERISKVTDTRFKRKTFDYQKAISDEYIYNMLNMDYTDHERDTNGQDTTHISVIDKNGMTVACTNTLTQFFGSRLYVNGFFLNNANRNFSGGVNKYAPGKRTRTYMSPTILRKGSVAENNEEIIAIGSPGGSMIPAVLVPVLFDMTMFGESMQAAVDKLRVVVKSANSLLVEVGESEAPPMVDPTGQGYYITRMDLNAYFGSVNVACYSSANGGFSAGADSRRNGKGSARNDLN